MEKDHRSISSAEKVNNFKELHSYILKSGDLTQQSAISFLVKCCNICLDCKDEISSKYYLTNILKSISLSISNPNEKQLLQYVQALYHILKYLVSKVSVDTTYNFTSRCYFMFSDLCLVF